MIQNFNSFSVGFVERRTDLDGGREAEEGDGDVGGATVLGRDRTRGAREESSHRERTTPNVVGTCQTSRRIHALRSFDGGR